MVESVDKRDERNERPGGGAEQAPARDVATTRTGEPFPDMSDKQTAPSSIDGATETPSLSAESAVQAELSATEPGVSAEAAPLELAATDTGARVIPFVPRNGVVRAAPLPQPVELRFARPMAGPAAYGMSVEPGAAFPPAQPPPPTGFRRGAGISAVAEDAPTGAAAPRFGAAGHGAAVGSAVQAFLARLWQSWSWTRALKYLVLGFAALLLAYALIVVILAVSYLWEPAGLHPDAEPAPLRH